MPCLLLPSCRRIVACGLLAATTCNGGCRVASAQQSAPAIASEYGALLASVYDEVLPLTDGETAQYIPALADAEPDQFGIAIVTVDGTACMIGDADVPFAIMSAAKPFTAALLVEQRGPDDLAASIGVEPTGMPFNSILAMELDESRTGNPLVNAGAIATVSRLQARDREDRWRRLVDFYGELAGDELTVMDDVYASVSTTNHRNRAIANLLANHGRLYCAIDEALDVYNRQSCVAVTATQLATMGATLANGGVHPTSGAVVMNPDHVDEVLAVMAMAGFYDESGRWAFEVGLPAKSGVGGGIVAIAPGRLAIAAFSPRLNASGNSVRAAAAIAAIANELALSVYRVPDRDGP